MEGKFLGTQYLAEYHDCSASVLDSVESVRAILIEASLEGRATIVTDVFHRFSPQGVSGVVVISESHVAIHTWPEHRCASVDVFSCSRKLEAERILELIGRGLHAKRMECRTLDRGRMG